MRGSARAGRAACVRGGGGGGGSSCIPRRDDWICQPAGTLITWAISRLTSHNRSHLWEWNDFGHSGSPEPGQSLRFKSAARKRGNQTARMLESRSVSPLENFLPLKQFFPLSFSKTTMANNKGSDVNRHFWVRKQRKLAVRKF